MRSLGAVRRADVCLIVIDSSEELSEQDVKIAGYVHEQGKPSIVVMNKWDVVEKDTYTIEKYNRKLKEELKFMDYFIPTYVSAKTGKRVDNLIKLAERAYENASRRISTGLLNDVLREAILTNEAAFKKRKTAENLLRYRSVGKSPDVRYFRQRRYADAFQLQAIP